MSDTWTKIEQPGHWRVGDRLRVHQGGTLAPGLYVILPGRHIVPLPKPKDGGK